jgi:hypothetical protein
MGAPGIGVDIAAAPRGREFGRRRFRLLRNTPVSREAVARESTAVAIEYDDHQP